MNTKDMGVIGDVLRQALAAHRTVLESLIDARTKDQCTVDRAKDLAAIACADAEARLQEFMRMTTSEVAEAIQATAADDVLRLRENLHTREQEAERIAREVQALRDDLGQVLAAVDEREAERRDEATERHATIQSQVETVAHASGSGLSELRMVAEALTRDVAALRDAFDQMRGHVDALPQAEDIVAELREDTQLREALRGAPGKDAEPAKDGAPGVGIEAPIWGPGIFRSGTLVQAYFGQYYRALKDTNAEPYGSPDWERVGTAGFHQAEPYAEGRTYEVGDLFVRDFGTFLQGPAGAILMAGRGPKGETPKPEPAIKPKDGLPGKDGASITHAEVRGSALVLITTNAKGEAKDISVDLGPVLEQFGNLAEARLIELLARPRE